ncbi:hypothetical protein Syun_030067 [Stephania yunnanensis]|uniref:Uncharacterized protein n=1 Tax=Stephania yunnanensis TaxID=152371 RepID=A0AAP0HGM5_9MAGN
MSALVAAPVVPAAALLLSSAAKPTNSRRKPPTLHHHINHRTSSTLSTTCSASNKPSSSPTQFSSTTKIRSEVLSPFRSVRMFFYLAFIASGSLGALIASTQFISSLIKQNPSTDLGETLKSLAIDLAAVALFSFLYSREDSAKKAQLARLSREEGLGNLRLRVGEGRVIGVSDLRGRRGWWWWRGRGVCGGGVSAERGVCGEVGGERGGCGGVCY